MTGQARYFVWGLAISPLIDGEKYKNVAFQQPILMFSREADPRDVQQRLFPLLRTHGHLADPAVLHRQEEWLLPEKVHPMVVGVWPP